MLSQIESLNVCDGDHSGEFGALLDRVLRLVIVLCLLRLLDEAGKFLQVFIMLRYPALDVGVLCQEELELLPGRHLVWLQYGLRLDCSVSGLCGIGVRQRLMALVHSELAAGPGSGADQGSLVGRDAGAVTHPAILWLVMFWSWFPGISVCCASTWIGRCCRAICCCILGDSIEVAVPCGDCPPATLI